MKKGFTLIELLAVILILGIIALIAIPTVNNILKESRRGAFQSTITNIEKAIEQRCTTEQIKNQEITTMYDIQDGIITPNLDIKGELPNGTIYVNNECIVSFELSDNNFIASKEFDGELVINEKGSVPVKYTEAILNGTDPTLISNLIPVTIKDDGTVTKADLYSKWYSYAEKKWANAVILTENGKVEDDGTILEDYIESYFVWIPRYKYKLFDMGNYTSTISEKPEESKADTIEIVFENKNTEVSVGTTVGQYHSHPAFQAFDANGLWVSKFETTGSIDNIQVKPNQYSLGYMNLKTMFEKAYNYKRNNESHMMKNTEWGAIVYLSLSKYGIDGEININNNNDLKTGYGATSTSDQSKYKGETGNTDNITQPYNTESGYKASTTGNITGVYDMSGGTYDSVAAYVQGSLASSGFNEDPASLYGAKYFDVYPSNTETNSFKNRILGDATGEFGPFYYYMDEDNNIRTHNAWFFDDTRFISTNYPWFFRGGGYEYGILGSQLAYSWHTGSTDRRFTFRIVLAN